MWIYLQNFQRLGSASCHTFHLPCFGPQNLPPLSIRNGTFLMAETSVPKFPLRLSIDAPPRFLGLVCLSIACKLYEGKFNFDLSSLPPERLKDVGISEILSTKDLRKLEMDFP
jgi:hypothetical protein